MPVLVQFLASSDVFSIFPVKLNWDPTNEQGYSDLLYLDMVAR